MRCRIQRLRWWLVASCLAQAWWPPFVEGGWSSLHNGPTSASAAAESEVRNRRADIAKNWHDTPAVASAGWLGYRPVFAGLTPSLPAHAVLAVVETAPARRRDTLVRVDKPACTGWQGSYSATTRHVRALSEAGTSMTLHGRHTEDEQAMKSTVETVGIGHSYSGRVALADVTFSLSPGTTAVVGVNGAGKSTLLRIIAGALKPGAGSIRLLG